MRGRKWFNYHCLKRLRPLESEIMSKFNDPEYTDEILEEVRRIKDELARKFDYDINRIFEDLLEQQRKSGRDYVSFAKKEAPQLIMAASL